MKGKLYNCTLNKSGRSLAGYSQDSNSHTQFFTIATHSNGQLKQTKIQEQVIRGKDNSENHSAYYIAAINNLLHIWCVYLNQQNMNCYTHDICLFTLYDLVTMISVQYNNYKYLNVAHVYYELRILRT